MTKKFGKRIARIRQQHRVSQREASEFFGISRGHLSDIERGAKSPSVEVLLKICRGMGQTPDYLLGF